MLILQISQVEEYLRTRSSSIQLRQIQAVINKNFHKSLSKKLNSMNASGPIIDPTVGNRIFKMRTFKLLKTKKVNTSIILHFKGRLQPWQHWHQDRIPNKNKIDKYLYQL
jgi:hypothetical protein